MTIVLFVLIIWFLAYGMFVTVTSRLYSLSVLKRIGVPQPALDRKKALHVAYILSAGIVIVVWVVGMISG